jgi:hypothetical protein
VSCRARGGLVFPVRFRHEIPAFAGMSAGFAGGR